MPDPRLSRLEDYMNNDQKNICESTERHLLVEGVAGSRKTDTLIRLGLRRHLKEKKSLLFLTQVGSVTDEIRGRIESYLGVTIYRQSGSNHYLVERGGITIEIANFDAWVHRQLEDCEWKHLFQMGSYHSHKIEALLEFCGKGEIKGFCMKNGAYADEIYIDEIQDFEVSRVRLVLAILARFPAVRAAFAGDYMQTIFERSLVDDLHPMREFTGIKRYPMQKCYRCPAAHLHFCNAIMAEAQNQHGCQPLLATNNNTVDKPFLFAHGSVSRQYDVHQVVLQLLDMLRILLEHDDTLTPSDICFLMRKSNDQSVFEILRTRLDAFWAARGHRNAVIHFATQFDGYRNSIQWNYAEGKSCLLSIHGDKGKGHKAVFFLGLTQKSIPDECCMFKNTELLYQSLLNVALTRSTRYLFVGFHHAQPSVYLSKIADHLPSLVYAGWSNPSDKIPTVYRKMLEVMRFPAPVFTNRYRETPLRIPRLNLMTVTEMSRRFERSEDILGYRPKLETVVFGKKTTLHLPHDLYPILGHMAELMLLRILSPETFVQDLEHWSDPSAVVFTDDERMLCWVHDFHLHRLMGTDMYATQLQLMEETHRSLFQQDRPLADLLQKLRDRPSYILPKCFLTPRFRQEMRLFTDRATRNESIAFTSWWNLALLFHEIKSAHRKPFLYRFLSMEMTPKQQSAFRQFMSNIRSLSSFFSQEIVFHPSHDVLAQVTDPATLTDLGFINEPCLDEKIFATGYHYGILGQSDVLDRGRDTLYEIKASHVDFSMEWLLQNSLYACLPFRLRPSAPGNLALANVITGKMYRWKSPQCHPKTLVHRLFDSIPTFPTELIDNLCRMNHKRFKKHDLKNKTTTE